MRRIVIIDAAACIGCGACVAASLQGIRPDFIAMMSRYDALPQ